MEKLRETLLEYLETKYNVSETVRDLAERVLEQLEKGSICLKIGSETEKAELKKSEAVGSGSEIRPLIFDGKNLYIQRYFVYQSRILERINELQKNKKLYIITGGPGTGKTTSLAKILSSRLNEKILLAAPTGKAAFRMRESLANQGIELESKTIHRLLSHKPLEANIIAIDECSMVDLPLMSKLLDAAPSDCDLYLLGDKHQLASVEAGSVFADICAKFEKNPDVYTELTKNWRAKEAPGIVKLSEEILNNSVKNFDNENVHYSGELSVENLFEEYKFLLKAENEKEAIVFLKSFQILCAIKKGRNGMENINKKLLSMAKHSKFTPIIITENNYQQNLFNGDTGVKDKEKAYFLNGEEIRTFPLLTLPKYDDAFAITIHKSQGSEYEKVAVVYPERDREELEQTILTKELLYTAITRAKKECFIFGNESVLAASCKKQIYRASGI
ncbi:MAG: AAA family ATPase [Fibromonadaceae bacterium]|jgi:exodeoxyribonuclease V alpha subunit|nr:AAA family ATPase [Fibromonadaceae bacterium]